VVVIGTGLAILEEEYSELPILWLDTDESSGEVFLLEADQLPDGEPAPAGSRA
jgi:ribosomal protein L3 glutamine methyltransferase